MTDVYCDPIHTLWCTLCPDKNWTLDIVNNCVKLTPALTKLNAQYFSAISKEVSHHGPTARILNLNPVDHHIWSVLEQRVYHTRNHLMTRLVEEWQMFDHSAIKQWCPRLRLCVQEQGGHFEHQLYCSLNLLYWPSLTDGALFETLYFVRCILNVHKKLAMSCMSLSKLPFLVDSFCCLYVWNFETNVPRFSWIITISLGVQFLSGHSVEWMKHQALSGRYYLVVNV